jgi:hypothetical protein
VEIMAAIKASRAARDGASARNGQPETVPYVYRQQRANTYAARIAQRNAQPIRQSPALLPEPGEYVPRRGSRPAPLAAPADLAGLTDLVDLDALGGPSAPGFGELG